MVVICDHWIITIQIQNLILWNLHLHMWLWYSVNAGKWSLSCFIRVYKHWSLLFFKFIILPFYSTVLYKIFVWIYFIVKNIQEKNFAVSQYPWKYFNTKLKLLVSCSIAIIVILIINLSILVRFITKQQQMKGLTTDS